MIKYKILEEYPTYYLCQHPLGWKECFKKMGIKIIEEDGERYIIINKIVSEDQGLDSDQVNKNFNKIL